jgi:hypothetical protein
LGYCSGQVKAIIQKLCEACQCHFILIGHVERETDAVLGGIKLMISTLGKALAPDLPIMFSDVILTERNADKWQWNTASAIADVKTRNLPIKADNPPTFKSIMEKWISRGRKQGELISNSQPWDDWLYSTLSPVTRTKGKL